MKIGLGHDIDSTEKLYRMFFVTMKKITVRLHEVWLFFIFFFQVSNDPFWQVPSRELHYINCARAGKSHFPIQAVLHLLLPFTTRVTSCREQFELGPRSAQVSGQYIKQDLFVVVAIIQVGF